MVTAVASTHRTSQTPKRTPLQSSDSGNGLPRRPKAREVASRYLSLSTSSSSNSSSSTNTTLSSITSGSSTSSRRSQSPIGNKPAVSTPKGQQRAVSAEGRRPPPPTPSNAERMLVTSMRSLSVSFQGESYALPSSKVKPPPTTVGTPGGSRKGTPERRKAGVTPMRDRKERDRENSRPSNQQQHRWPGRLRGQDSSVLTRSLDYGAGIPQSVGSGSALKELKKSVADETSRNKAGAESKLENNATEFRSELNRRSKLGDSVDSDVKSVSSDSSLSGKATHPKCRPGGLVVRARFCQDSGNNVHKALDPDSPLSSDRTIGLSKSFAATKFQNNSPVSSPRDVFPTRGLSPLRGFVRPASPNKALNSPTSAKSRGIASPLKARSGEGISMNDKNNYSTPSMFRFAVDARKGQSDENRIADAHHLRLLYNRLLQWRLANAKLENTLLVQKHTAERSLYNAWVTTSKLQHSVGFKRNELQLLKHNSKIYHILKEQEPHLECWGLFDRDHCNSVSGAIEALKASTIRLPIVGNAKADVCNVQEAIFSAVDVMQTMASSVGSLLAKVEQINLLVSELSNVSASEHRLLDEYKEFSSTTFIPLQVMHCSLRTHVLQQAQQQPTSLSSSKGN